MKYFLFVILLSFSSFLMSYDVKIEISGSIKDNPCEVVITNNVNLGYHDASQLSRAGQNTDLIKFSIGLEQCPSNLKTVQFKFVGEPDQVNTNLLKTETGNGTAQNVGIAIYEEDKNTLIPINSDSKVKNLSDKNSFNFYGSYVSTGAVSYGKANATTTLEISYN